jgi:hypothetical protein
MTSSSAPAERGFTLFETQAQLPEGGCAADVAWAFQDASDRRAPGAPSAPGSARLD